MTSSAPAPASAPHGVFIVLYRSGEHTLVMGVYAAPADANAEARRLRKAQGAAAASAGNAGTDTKLERWGSPEGEECWVERHAVIARQTGGEAAA